MKKIWLMLLMLCAACAFSACSDDDDETPGDVNPIAGVNVPKTAELGAEIIVKGSGFNPETAKLYLLDSKQAKTMLENVEFSATGATFKIPVTLTVGKYTLYVTQNGDWKLGEIDVTEVAFPITDPVYPAELLIGKSLTIGGNGFNESAKIYLEDSEGNRTELEITDRTTGVTCAVPDDLIAGAAYKLILTQDNGEWVLVEELVATTPVVVKRLKKMTVYSLKMLEDPNAPEGFLFGDVETYTELVYNSPTGQLEKVKKSERVILNGSEVSSTEPADYLSYSYNSTGGHIDVTVNEPNEIRSFSFDVTDGKIANGQIDYILYDESIQSIQYKWDYDAVSGYLQAINEVDGTPYLAYNYTGNNLNKIVWTDEVMQAGEVFEYGEETCNPNGIDVALYLFMATNEAFEGASFLGMGGEKSVNLPTAYSAYDGYVGSGLTCTTDEDGYVTSVVYQGGGEASGGMLPSKVEFEYETVE